MSRILTMLMGLAAVMTLGAAPAAATVGESAVGAGTVPDPMGSVLFLETFAVDATATGQTSATGTMSLTRTLVGGSTTMTWTATVRCLTVEGSRALVTGTITSVTGYSGGTGDTPGDTIIFDLRDFGTAGVPAPDRFAFSVSSPDFPCVSSVFDLTRPLSVGEITLVDALDTDGDGIGDAGDNCPLLANADQADADADGIGDACDPVNDLDSDLDGVIDTADNCPDVGNADQSDRDGDGAGDTCDSHPNNKNKSDGTNQNRPPKADHIGAWRPT